MVKLRLVSGSDEGRGGNGHSPLRAWEISD